MSGVYIPIASPVPIMPNLKYLIIGYIDASRMNNKITFKLFPAGLSLFLELAIKKR